MSIKRTFNGATIIHPGAFSKIVVENLSGFPLQPTGTVGIVGEAQGGQPGVLDILSKEGIQDAKKRYKSGPIADALELLVNPSKDPRIANGASTIVVFKTNASVQSSLNLNALSLKSANYGSDENNLNALVSVGSVVDSEATILGTINGPFALVGGETLILNVNGTVRTYTGTLVGASVTAAALIAELNNTARWAGGIKPVIASVVGSAIQIVADPAVVGASKNYVFMKVDPTCTLDTVVGITGSARGVKGSRIMTFVKGASQEVTMELGGLPVISLQYIGAGSACALSVQMSAGAMVLSTAVTGGPGNENLSMTLKNAAGVTQFTIKQLVDQINANPAYQASVLYSNPSIGADQLDFYNAIRIDLVALSLKRDIYDAMTQINTLSQLVVATRVDNQYNPIATSSVAQFFTGAVDGVSANSDYSNGYEGMKSLRVNVVVPLISVDAGSVTIDSVNQLAAAHASWGWSTTGKSERQVVCSKLTSKASLKTAAMALGLGYAQMVGQQVQVLDKNANLVWMDPWALACILAGLRAGAEVGEPLTYKFVNVNDVRVQDSSWNPKKDYAEMIEAGVTFLESVDSGGFRVCVGNTTYTADGSFVWNRESVVQAAGYVAYDLRQNLEATFTGTKAKTGTAEAVANFIKARMSAYLEADIIVGDDLNDDKGYTNLRVSIQGNTALINVSITPVQGVDFLLPTIYLADIKQSA